MYVRIARFEGGTSTGVDAAAEGIRRDIEAASRGEAGDVPPELAQLISKVIMLTDKSRGSSATLMFFETEEDLHKADSILDQMSPDSQDMGRRVSLDSYAVAFENTGSMSKAA
jgi:hypothetical protein